MHVALGAGLALLGSLPAAAGLYLLILSLAAFRYSAAPISGNVGARLTVLVPAHNESDLIARCVRSLRDQDYPANLYRVVVIADNCTDDTAAIAGAEGAHVMVRVDPDRRGKGRALRWAMDQVLAAADAPDAVIVVDGDSVVNRDFLAALVTELEAGHDAVQAEYLTLEEGRSGISALALFLFHRVRLSGRAVLGMPSNLLGNGMLFSRSLLERSPWSAFTGAEDLEFSIKLRLLGERPRFTAAAQVFGPMPSGGPAAQTQRERWEGGRFYVVRTQLPTLLAAVIRRPRSGVLDAAIDLAVPPLGLLAAIALAGAALAGGLVLIGLAPAWALITWLLACAAIPAFVLIGLRAGRAPRSLYMALAQAPGFVIRKLLLYPRLLRSFDPHRWVRTQRPSDARPAAIERVEIAGVPIDPADMESTLNGVRSALEGRRPLQICTVNLDFLVNAQTDPEVRSVLRRSDLNVADGAPVVWLSRLRGAGVPSRVAGADLFPLMVDTAAEMGVSIFLLGGEDGTARLCADALARRWPRLKVAGWMEPPRASLDGMDTDEIIRRYRESGASILFVALGHPKQDKWIARNRHRLGATVAIGVGCSMDVFVGKTRRAPSWMRNSGLEWFYRLLSEPRRLLGRYLRDAAWLPVLVLIAIGDRTRPAAARA